jgi:hypothetical protein
LEPDLLLRSIEEECHDLLEEEFPKLMSAADGESLRGALLDIELHLRHLVYHARDTRYFLDVDLNWKSRDEVERDHRGGPSR